MNEATLDDGELTSEVLLPGTRSTALPVDALHAHRNRTRRSLMMLLDGGMVVTGFVLAYVLRYVLQLGRLVREENQQPLAAFLPMIELLAGTTVVILLFRGLYRLPRNASWLNQMSVVVPGVTMAVAFTIVVTFIAGASAYSRLIFGFALVATIAMLGLARWVVTAIRRDHWSSGRDLERVLVVGGTGLARQVVTNLQNQRESGYQVVGCVADCTPGSDPGIPAGTPFLGQIEALPSTVARRSIERVIVALPFWENHRLPAIVDVCYRLGVPFHVVPDFYELSFDRVTMEELGGIPLIDFRENMIHGWNLVIKRLLDVSLVVLGLPLWGTLSLLIMLAIKLDSPGPVVFRQTRIGRNGRPFEFLKFRTMVANAEELKSALIAQNEGSGPMFKIKQDPRRTRVGSWLRRTSLDEIPQFWNVLRGEMSLVGPRPAVPEEVGQYEAWQRRRLEVMPGCTGLWQATGRSNTTFEQMIQLDIYYAEHWSIGMDIRILLMTIPAIVSGHGAY